MDNLTYYTNWANIGSFFVGALALFVAAVSFYFGNLKTKELEAPPDRYTSTQEAIPDLPDHLPYLPTEAARPKSMHDLLARRRAERWGEIMGDRISSRGLIDNYVEVRRLSWVTTLLGLLAVIDGWISSSLASILIVPGMLLIVTSVASLWFARARIMRRFFS